MRLRASAGELLREARQRIEELTGLPAICPDSSPLSSDRSLTERAVARSETGHSEEGSETGHSEEGSETGHSEEGSETGHSEEASETGHSEYAWYAQMAAFPLPACDAGPLQRWLYDEYRVEVPIIEWGGRQLALWGVSVQGYNTEEDVEALAEALRVVLG